MYLIVGLGNPGKEYENTRHNIGWMLLDTLKSAHSFPAWQKKFKGEFTRLKIAGNDLVLLKPHTYMNLSGESVQPAAAFFKIPPENIIVIHDELDIAFLNLRTKLGGGDAGHNGLKSITATLGTPNYHRLRIGIGRPAHKNQVSSYVLHPFSAAEALDVDQTLTKLAEKLPAHLADLKQIVKPV